MNPKVRAIALFVTAACCASVPAYGEPKDGKLVDLGDAFKAIRVFACGFDSQRQQFVFKQDEEGEYELVGPDLEDAEFRKTGKTFTVIDEDAIYQISDRASMKSTNGEAVQGDCLDMTQDLWTVAHALVGEESALVPDVADEQIRLLENQVTTQRRVLNSHIKRLQGEVHDLREQLAETNDRREVSNRATTGSRRRN